jgi:hypothetical protein
VLPIKDSQPEIYHLFFVQVSAGVGSLPKKVVRFVADLSRPLADFVHSAPFAGDGRGNLAARAACPLCLGYAASQSDFVAAILCLPDRQMAA